MRTNSVLHHLFQFLKTCPNKCPTNFEKLHSFLCTLGLCVNVLRLGCHVNALLALRAARFVFPHSEKLSENYSMYSENVLGAWEREGMLPMSEHQDREIQDSEVYICPSLVPSNLCNSWTFFLSARFSSCKFLALASSSRRPTSATGNLSVDGQSKRMAQCWVCNWSLLASHSG